MVIVNFLGGIIIAAAFASFLTLLVTGSRSGNRDCRIEKPTNKFEHVEIAETGLEEHPALKCITNFLSG